jgi:hypothetical protein
VNGKGAVASVMVGLTGASTGGLSALICLGAFTNSSDNIMQISLLPGAIIGFITCFSFSAFYLKTTKNKMASSRSSRISGRWKERGGRTFSILAGIVSGLLTGVAILIVASYYESSKENIGTFITFGLMGGVIGLFEGWGIGSLLTRVFNAFDWYPDWLC